MKQTGDNAKQEFIKTAYELEDSFGENHRGGGFIPAKFGLCSSCDCFSYAELQYSREYAKCNCDNMGRWPNGSNPVMKCSRYEKRGQTSLREMAELAYYISADKKRIGFERG